MRVRRVLSIAALCTAVAAPVFAIGIDDGVNGPAGATQTARPVSAKATDVVTVFNSGTLRSSVADAAINAARAGGASVAFGRAASVGMIGLWRGPNAVQLPPGGFAYPMGTTVLPLDLVARTMGRDISANLTPTTAVMGALTASLRGAQAGDLMQLVSGSGAVVPITIAAVVDDAIIGGTEVLVSPEAADRLGITNLNRAVMWGFADRAAIDSAMAANGLVSTAIRIRRSWDPPDPDETIGMARTKAELGEFAYRVNGDGSVSVDGAWKAANITSGSIGGLLLQTGCHQKVRPAIQAAMTELTALGLAGTINYVDANRAGGCFLARFNRLTPDSSLGFLSRHSWGQAVDTNTVGSCQGCAPPDLDCRTVQIFRKHGFAWGGNFLTPDGMHFEWVGQRRDLLPYPSRFCGNTGAYALATGETGSATLYASDGMVTGDH